jgi:iron complex outermembrane receptor protein
MQHQSNSRYIACAVGCVLGIGAAPLARADEPRTAGSPPPTAAAPDVEEVVVRGIPVRDPTAPKDEGVAGMSVPRERLVGPGLEAQDVLRSLPGVAVTESGGFGAPSTAAIRGATAADTPVYLAGVRLNDDIGGTADLSMVPLWLIDRIEVYRGNAPIEADELGPGGAIFFEPRRPTKDMGGLGYYGGSWGTSKGWAYEGAHAGPVSALVGVSADHANNRYPFSNDHGTLLAPQTATPDVRQNADEGTLDGWALARVDLDRGASVDLVANGITREQGVPSLALVQTKAAREHLDRWLGSVRARVPLDGTGRNVLDARTSVIASAMTYDDPLLELALFAKHVSIVGRRVEESVGAVLEPGERLRLRPVVDVEHEQIDRDPNNVPVGRAHREFVRAAVTGEYRIADPIALRVLASGECHHTGARPDSTCDVLEPTGRAGIEVGSSRVRVLANVGRYVRVPTLGEVYGVDATVHGNPGLAPESGYTVDAGLRLQAPPGLLLGGAYLDAFVFGHWVDGLIAYERAGLGYVVPYNVGSARVLGAELLASLAFTKIVRLDVSVTALDPRDTSANRTTVNDLLPYRSPFVASPVLRADWKRPCRWGLSGAGANVRVLYQSSRYADPAGLGVIAAQTTVDLEAYLAWFDGILTLRGRVSDLFDAVRTDVIGYPLPARSVYFGLEATW